MVDPDSWQFGVLLYLLVGWFPTRYIEKSIVEREGPEKAWSFLGFLVCWAGWLPFMIAGFVSSFRK